MPGLFLTRRSLTLGLIRMGVCLACLHFRGSAGRLIWNRISNLRGCAFVDRWLA